MTQGEGSLSFVLPAFNEADNIESAILHCVEVGEQLKCLFEVIVVDDGSQDDTRRRVEKLSREAEGQAYRIRALHHPRNRGYGAALKTGLLSARMHRVFFTDADLQFDVAEIQRLLYWSDRFHIVVGYRANRQDPIVRRFNGWAWSRLVDLLFDTGVRDVDCAFKLFDRSVFERISIDSIGAFVNTEILVRARAAGFTVFEVPVTHYPRTAGTQSGAHPRVVARAFRELMWLRSDLKNLGDAEARSEGLGRSTTSGKPTDPTGSA